MPSPKVYCALLLACLVASAAGGSRHRRTDVSTIAACMTRKVASLDFLSGPCAAAKLISAYREMRSANCINCDRYFHCMGSYRAVTQCGNYDSATRAEEAMNDCRGVADSAADQEAKRYGRDGGDCARRYLAAVECAYNPATKTCG